MAEPPRRGRRRVLRPVLAVAVVALCAFLLAREAQGLQAAIERLSPARVALAGLAAVVGTVCIERLWLSLVRGLGLDVGSRDAAEVFYVTQLGKYLPGSVWPVLAQVQLGLRWGAPRRLMVAANLLLLVAVTLSGILVGGVLLPWSSSDGLAHYWWLVVLLVPLALLLHPRAVTGLIDHVLRAVGREPLRAQLSIAGLSRALAWAAATWLVLGGHLLILMAGYANVGPDEVAAAVGAMGLAWAAGMVFIPAPAGAGVREAVLVLTLGPLVGTGAALSVALASRVLLVVADVALAGAAAGRRRLLGPQRRVSSEVCSG